MYKLNQIAIKLKGAILAFIKPLLKKAFSMEGMVLWHTFIGIFPRVMQKRIKVLETIRQGMIGGGESHLLSLVENLDREKFEPIVLSFTDGPMVEKLKNMGIKTEVIYTEKPFDIFIWKKVVDFIKENQIQLIHAHGTRANSNVFWSAKKLKLPLIYTIHGWSFHNDQNVFVRNLRLWGEKLLTSESDINISVSESNQLTGKNHISGFNSVVINNGIDQNKFNPNKNFKDIRVELGIDAKEIIVLFLARFVHQKQPLKLIKAFAKALETNHFLKLLLVGDGDQKTEAIEMVNKLQIQEKVVFQAFREDMPEIFTASDIFVLPSLWEGQPIALLEAMAMGKAIIATKVDGTSEVIQDQKNGVLIETHNLENDLTNAILKLAGNEKLQQELGSNAIETVSVNYSAANMTRKIEDLYWQVQR